MDCWLFLSSFLLFFSFCFMLVLWSLIVSVTFILFNLKVISTCLCELICLSVYLSIISVNLSICIYSYKSISLSTWQSVYVSICLCVYLYMCLSVYVSICLCVYLSMCLSVYVSICLCVYLSMCLSVYVSICLSVFFIFSFFFSIFQKSCRCINI